MSKLVGIDIGASEVKLVLVKDGTIRRLGRAQLPDDLVREGRILSGAAMSSFLRQAAHDLHIPRGDCAIVIPASRVFFRRLTMPLMRVQDLKLNLPYEFRDFITREKDKYFYDYALLGLVYDGQTGQAKEMDLMAAAVEKAVIVEYRDMLRRAGFKLKVAMPEELAYYNLIRRFCRLAPQGPAEFCLLDLGHDSSRVHIFTRRGHEATSVISFGGAATENSLSEVMHVDRHVARSYMLTNFKQALTQPACETMYIQAGIELQRVLNFYRYNNPANELRDVYFCGGGAESAPLVEALISQIDLTPHHIADLLPQALKSKTPASLSLYPVAYGVTLNEEVR